ncbi:MAG: hypothetical protein HW411_805, partial [Gammaproteobacteria bacterium]|nr:hypothetical protein [Gammaproteobacteria bacterium]
AAYTSIVLSQFANILSRRTSQSVFSSYLFSNKHLWNALIISLVVVLILVNVPAIGVWFGFEPMRLHDWIWPVSGAVVFLFWFELKKLFFAGFHSP